MNKDMDWYTEHPDEWEKLTEEEQGKVFLGENEDVDLKADVDDRTTEEDPDKKEEPTPPERPVILAKDGKATIPYEELEASRVQAQKLEQIVKEQTELIKDLREAKEQDLKAGTGTKEQEKIIAKYEGEYPDLMADVGPHIEKMIEEKAAIIVDAFKKEVETLKQVLDPIEAKLEAKGHFDAIAEKHPNYEEIGKSKELKDWIDSLPGFVKQAAVQVIKKGTAGQVVELLDAFVASRPMESEVVDKDKVKAKLDEARLRPVPKSLSDVSGGSPKHNDKNAILEMTSREWGNRCSQLSSEEILETLNKVM